MWSLLDAVFIFPHAHLPMKSIRYSDSFYAVSDSYYLELSLYLHVYLHNPSPVIQCSIIAELAEDGEQFGFKIVFHGTGNRSYTLGAESQESMEQWMKTLACASYDYMKLMVAELQRQLDEMEGERMSCGFAVIHTC